MYYSCTHPIYYCTVRVQIAVTLYEGTTTTLYESTTLYVYSVHYCNFTISSRNFLYDTVYTYTYMLSWLKAPPDFKYDSLGYDWWGIFVAIRKILNDYCTCTCTCSCTKVPSKVLSYESTFESTFVRKYESTKVQLLLIRFVLSYLGYLALKWATYCLVCSTFPRLLFLMDSGLSRIRRWVPCACCLYSRVMLSGKPRQSFIYLCLYGDSTLLVYCTSQKYLL